MVHETVWICEDIGATAAAGDATAGAWAEHGGGGASSRRVCCVRLAMASGRGPGRAVGAGGQAGARPPTQTEAGGVPETGGPTVEGGVGLRLSQRTVDTEAHR